MSTASNPASAGVHEWAEAYIPLASIIKHPPFQVRDGLSPAAVRRYAEMTKAGKVAPPIAVALIGSAHYLIDGWHRMEAGALTTTADDRVLALLAPMTHKQAVWAAAQANEGHGVQLTRAEWRKVFRAFIKSGQHKLPRGGAMSYRAMGDALGKPHTTIRSWVKADFPRLFRKIGEGAGNPSPGQPAGGKMSLDQERIKQAHDAARTLQQIADVLTTAEARGELVRVLEGALRSLRDGTKPVAFSDF